MDLGTIMNAIQGFIQALRANLCPEQGKYTSLEKSLLESKYCGFTMVPSFIVPRKRIVGDVDIGVSPNEFITPHSGLVRWVMQQEVKGDDVQTIADWACEKLRWVTDGARDKWGYPNEVLAFREDDCEGIAFTVASFNPDRFGVGFGFLNGEGHAFNVFVEAGELWILDCAGDNPIMAPIDALETSYDLHWIFTTNLTFRNPDKVTKRFWETSYELEG